MAALAGCGVHNALVEVDGPEVPILDGSALPFVRAFWMRALQRQDAPVRAIEVLKEVTVEPMARLGASWRRWIGLEMDFTIEFDDAQSGGRRRWLTWPTAPSCANSAIAAPSAARPMSTRCTRLAWHWRHAGQRRRRGWRHDVLSPGGFRHADEAVRHKMLDALGDLALAGAPILGRYTGKGAAMR
jgi:UDP-3-O-[3-hydroxymyristoyl] N-acetylglucosamine deacetylase